LKEEFKIGKRIIESDEFRKVLIYLKKQLI